MTHFKKTKAFYTVVTTNLDPKFRTWITSSNAKFLAFHKTIELLLVFNVHSWPLFPLLSTFPHTVNSKKCLLMSEFKPRSSCVGSNCSVNCAKITTLDYYCQINCKNLPIDGVTDLIKLAKPGLIYDNIFCSFYTTNIAQI